MFLIPMTTTIAPPPLTPKEVALLALLADGYSYLNAAGQLDITINTVRNHVRSLYSKLGVHTKSEAVTRAIQHGILRWAHVDAMPSARADP